MCVGSPGTFSTRKCRSATVAICGRCVIVTTCARSARRRSVSATACAVVPPMPASISSKTIVSPPATAAIASATRESSPPDAVSATGPNGRPAFGRIRKTTSSAPVAPGSRSRELDPELAVAEADRLQLGRDRLGERLGAASRARLAQLGVQPVDLGLGALRAPARPPRTGSWPSSSASSSRARLLAALEQLGERLRAVAAPQVGEAVELCTRPPRAGRARPRASRRNARRSDAVSRSCSSAWRSASPAACQLRARAARAARPRARRRATRSVAPSPSSGASASAAAAAPSASSVTWRSRSRSARSSSSRPGSSPSVSSASARSSSSRACAAAASRVSSS